MQIPQHIVSQWSDFVARCCLGVEPAEAPADVNRAFDALRRLWPEYLSEVQAQDPPGIFRIAPAISRGLTLAACEPLRGFGPVMARVRKGEVSALAELQFAATLVKSGLTPELEPGDKRLDCSVEVGSETVFAEVIAPARSEAITSAQATIERVVANVVERNTGTHTEILLAVEPDTQFDTIVASATATPPDEAVHHVEGIGRFRRTFLGPQPPNVGPTIFVLDPPPVIAASRVTQAEDGIFTSATIRLPVMDQRAHRLLSAEHHHFSRTERNILVMSLSGVPGRREWLPLIERWFQPGRNRRVGAVALYYQGLGGTPPAIRRRWRVLVNPYALVPVPDSLIHAILLRDQDTA
jgi:hypothetical protein